MKHILPESDNTFTDIKNLNKELISLKEGKSDVKGSKVPLKLEVTDDPSAMLVMGEEPIPTCQSCKEEKTNTRNGELINRIRLGQLKLANIYQGDSLVARTVLEAGSDKKGNPALLVERLYTLPGKELDISQIESMLISYASHVKADTIYWGDKNNSWPLKNRKTQTKPYKLLSQQRLKLYRDSFGKDGGEAPAIAVPVSPSPFDPLSLKGEGKRSAGEGVTSKSSKKNLLSLIALPALAGILAFLGIPDIAAAATLGGSGGIAWLVLDLLGPEALALSALLYVCSFLSKRGRHAATYSLHKAIRKGDLEAVKQAIKNKAKLDGRYGDILKEFPSVIIPLVVLFMLGVPAIFYMASMFGYLLAIGSLGHWEKIDYRQWTPLTYAVNNGNIEISKLLINSGADVNAVDKSGQTALEVARANGNDQMTKLLEDAGAKEAGSGRQEKMLRYSAKQSRNSRAELHLALDTTPDLRARSENVSPDKKFLGVVYEDSSAKIFDIRTGRDMGIPMGPDTKYIFFFPDSKFIGVSYKNKPAKIFEIATGMSMEIPADPNVRYACFSSDGDFVGANYKNNTAKVFDIATGADMEVPFGSDVKFIFFPMPGLVVAMYLDGSRKIFELETGEDSESLVDSMLEKITSFFGDRHADDPQDSRYYAADPKTAERLKIVFENSPQGKDFSSDWAKINQSNHIKKMGSQWEIRFPGEEDPHTIYTYGFPYKVKSTQYIDFAIWYGGDDTVSDMYSPVLRRMPYADFREYVLDGFMEYYVRGGKSLVMPKRALSRRRGTELDFVKFVKEQENRVQIVFSDGAKRMVSRDELFYWNGFINRDELGLLKQFSEAGGKGDLVYFDSDNSKEFNFSGLYMAVKEFPDHFAQTGGWLFLKDKAMLAELKKLLAQKTPILLTGEDHGTYAAVAPVSHRMVSYMRNRLGFKRGARPFMVICPHAGIYTLKHEMVHWQDFYRKEFQKLHKNLEMLISKGLISINEAKGLSTFIIEQRAYASQLEAIASDLNKGKAYIARKRSAFRGSEKVPFDQYYRSQKDRFTSVLSMRYALKVHKLLTRLNKDDPAIYREILQLLKQYSAPSLILGVEKILSYHFRKSRKIAARYKVKVSSWLPWVLAPATVFLGLVGMPGISEAATLAGEASSGFPLSLSHHLSTLSPHHLIASSPHLSSALGLGITGVLGNAILKSKPTYSKKHTTEAIEALETFDLAFAHAPDIKFSKNN
ncbi:ankyrin repeat domain-containing protein, partial [Elusimicrobiota bacterium]